MKEKVGHRVPLVYHLIGDTVPSSQVMEQKPSVGGGSGVKERG